MPHAWQKEEHGAQKPECRRVGDGFHALYPHRRITYGAYDYRIRVQGEQFGNETVTGRVSYCCVAVKAVFQDGENGVLVRWGPRGPMRKQIYPGFDVSGWTEGCLGATMVDWSGEEDA